MVVRFKKVISLSVAFVMLVITMLSAATAISENSSVSISEIYFEGDDLVVEYLPVFDSVNLVVCEFVLDDQIFVTNIISTNSKVNKLSEYQDLEEGLYSFFIYCESGSLSAESEEVMLRVTGEVFDETEEITDEEDKESRSFNDLFYFLIILIALVLMIRGLRPKTSKKKNKRLKRFY